MSLFVISWDQNIHNQTIAITAITGAILGILNTSIMIIDKVIKRPRFKMNVLYSKIINEGDNKKLRYQINLRLSSFNGTVSINRIYLENPNSQHMFCTRMYDCGLETDLDLEPESIQNTNRVDIIEYVDGDCYRFVENDDNFRDFIFRRDPKYEYVYDISLENGKAKTLTYAARMISNEAISPNNWNLVVEYNDTQKTSSPVFVS